MVIAILKTTVCFLVLCDRIKGYCGVPGQTMDQPTTSRPNTLSDDADDLQRQLDNEVREKLQYGRITQLFHPNIVWVLSYPPTKSNNINHPYKFVHFDNSLIRKTKEEDRYNNIKYDATNDNLEFHNEPNSLVNQLNWIYQDQQNWYKLYTGCGGKFQSPIDLPVSGLVKVHGQRPLIFGNYAEVPLTMTMFFDGNRIIVHGKWHKNNMPLIFGGAAHSRRYIFYCLSMHWPTEHKIGGLSYPLELQILHISAEYASFEDAMKGSNNDPMAFLCVSVIFRYEQHTHPPLKNLLKAGIRSRASNVSLNPIPLSHISPPFHNYVAYHGSLPVPPCTESVLWIVRSKALPIKREFLEAVNVALSIQGETEKLLGRSVQSLNDRKVYLFNL